MTREVDGPVSVGRCSKGKTDGFCLGSVKLCTFFTLEKKININHSQHNAVNCKASLELKKEE